MPTRRTSTRWTTWSRMAMRCGRFVPGNARSSWASPRDTPSRAGPGGGARRSRSSMRPPVVPWWATVGLFRARRGSLGNGCMPGTWSPTPPSVQHCVDGWPHAPAECPGALPLGDEPRARRWVQLLMGHATHTGAEVRRGPERREHPGLWPRRSLKPKWWTWKIVVSAEWRSGSREQHINKLELRSCLSALRWRLRSLRNYRTRFLHCVDSQVAMGALIKARSSSFDLQPVVDRYNATVLAARARPVLAYFHTKVNPADAPSRKRIWKGAWRAPVSSQVRK